MPTVKVSVKKGKWLGVPGMSTVYHLDKRDIGLRVSVMELEGKPTEVRLIEGDGRKTNFIVHCAGVLS